MGWSLKEAPPGTPSQGRAERAARCADLTGVDATLACIALVDARSGLEILTALQLVCRADPQVGMCSGVALLPAAHAIYDLSICCGRQRCWLCRPRLSTAAPLVTLAANEQAPRPGFAQLSCG